MYLRETIELTTLHSVDRQVRVCHVIVHEVPLSPFPCLPPFVSGLILDEDFQEVAEPYVQIEINIVPVVRA
jgi:hypothetical protein